MPGHQQKRKSEHVETSFGSSSPSASVPPSAGHSALWVLLMKKFADGLMSATEVQQIAMAAVQSGANTSDLQQLASLAASGNSQGNSQRDLMRMLFHNVMAPEPYEITTPLLTSQGVQDSPFHILLPHDWISAIADKQLLPNLLGTDGLQEFWAQQNWSQNPQLKAAHVFKTVRAECKTECWIPLLVHGDGAPFTEVDSIEVFSMRGLLATKSVQVSQFLLFLSPKACLVEASMNNIWKTVVWSFKALIKGEHPKADENGVLFAEMIGRNTEQEKRHNLAGKPLGCTQKIKAVVMAITGDIDWFCHQFGFPYAMSNNPCPYCRCDNLFSASAIPLASRMPFTDFRKTAEWRKHLVPHTELAESLGKHKLMEIPGVTALSIKLDVLHVIDLGVAAHVYGNLLWSLLEDKIAGSREASLKELNRLVCDAYNVLEVPAQQRIGRLNVSNLNKTGSSYPCLAHIKGRKIRMFSEAAVLLAEKFLDHDIQATKHTLALVKALNSMYSIIDMHVLVWSPSVQEKFQSCTEALLAHYSFLANDAINKKLHRFSITQKFHLTAHLPVLFTPIHISVPTRLRRSMYAYFRLHINKYKIYLIQFS